MWTAIVRNSVELQNMDSKGRCWHIRCTWDKAMANNCCGHKFVGWKVKEGDWSRAYNSHTQRKFIVKIIAGITHETYPSPLCCFVPGFQCHQEDYSPLQFCPHPLPMTRPCMNPQLLAFAVRKLDCSALSDHGVYGNHAYELV